MTIASATARIKHEQTVGGNKTFSFPFKIFDADDLTVTEVVNGTEFVRDRITHYTVTGVGDDNGGTVEFVTAPDLNDFVIIERVMDVIQQTDLMNAGNFFPKSHEEQFDKCVQICQQIEALLGTNDRANARVPILRTKDDVGSGGYDCLSSQLKNVDDPTDPQDAVTLASLGAGIIYDVIFPVFTWATRPDANSTEYEIIRVRDAGGPMHWQFRCQKTDDTYVWISGPQAPPF